MCVRNQKEKNTCSLLERIHCHLQWRQKLAYLYHAGSETTRKTKAEEDFPASSQRHSHSTGSKWTAKDIEELRRWSTLAGDQSPPLLVVKQDVDNTSGFSFSPTALYQHVGAVQKRTPSPQRQQHRGGSCRWITSPVPCWSRDGRETLTRIHSTEMWNLKKENEIEYILKELFIFFIMYSIYTRQLMAELGKWGGVRCFNQVLVLAPRTREKHLQFLSKQWIRCLCWAVCSVCVSVRTADRQTDTAMAATVEGPSLSRTADATLTFDFWDCGGSFDLRLCLCCCFQGFHWDVDKSLCVLHYETMS